MKQKIIEDALLIMDQEIKNGETRIGAARKVKEELKLEMSIHAIRWRHLKKEQKIKECKKEIQKKHIQCIATDAMQFSVIAISQLERIRHSDPEKNKALDKVQSWIEKNRI